MSIADFAAGWPIIAASSRRSSERGEVASAPMTSGSSSATPARTPAGKSGA